MASQNLQNFQNHLFNKESRQPAPFQGILKDAQRRMLSIATPQGGVATANGCEPLHVRKMKVLFVLLVL